MSEAADTELAQALDAAYAAYKRRVGRPYAMERLRNMLARDFAAQQVIDDATGADDHWKRLGEEARKQADEVLQAGQSERRAAE